MSRKIDKELFEEMESLGDIIEWLENRNADVEKQPQSFAIDEKALKEWLEKPTLEQARSWLKKKPSAPV
jgi:hypothetical protein